MPRSCLPSGRLSSQASWAKELLVPATRFQREFPNHVAIMRELRGARLAKTEGGEQPKLTIKVPSAICGTGRVYCVVIGRATA